MFTQLWDCDVNRCEPGHDYSLDLQGTTTTTTTTIVVVVVVVMVVIVGAAAAAISLVIKDLVYEAKTKTFFSRSRPRT